MLKPPHLGVHDLLSLFSLHQLNSISTPLSWQGSPSQSLLEFPYLPGLHQNPGDV